MTYCSTYIGDLDDPNFDVMSAGPVGNIPRGLTKDFPPDGEHYNRNFHKWTAARQIPHVQTDYDAFAAKVTKAQLKDYIEFAFGSLPSYTDPQHMLLANGRPYCVERLDQLKVFINALPDDKLYALVAECD